MEASNLKRKRGTSIQPRWYNQAYLLFLALRQHPQNSLPRIQLIEAAIELDKKIGVELQLPRVFRGKVSLFCSYTRPFQKLKKKAHINRLQKTPRRPP